LEPPRHELLLPVRSHISCGAAEGFTLSSHMQPARGGAQQSQRSFLNEFLNLVRV